MDTHREPRAGQARRSPPVQFRIRVEEAAGLAALARSKGISEGETARLLFRLGRRHLDTLSDWERMERLDWEEPLTQPSP